MKSLIKNFELVKDAAKWVFFNFVFKMILLVSYIVLFIDEGLFALMFVVSVIGMVVCNIMVGVKAYNLYKGRKRIKDTGGDE